MRRPARGIAVGPKATRGLVFGRFGRGMQRMCIVVHLGFCLGRRGDFCDNLRLALNHWPSFICKEAQRRLEGAGLWCGKCFS